MRETIRPRQPCGEILKVVHAIQKKTKKQKKQVRQLTLKWYDTIQGMSVIPPFAQSSLKSSVEALHGQGLEWKYMNATSFKLHYTLPCQSQVTENPYSQGYTMLKIS